VRASGASDAAVDAARVALQLMHSVVFCHNDLLSGNVLDVDAESRVQIIDYEYGALVTHAARERCRLGVCLAP
jgi:thiamine kinase-like enzyme